MLVGFCNVRVNQYLPVSKAWSTLTVVDLIVVILISAGILSPTVVENGKKRDNGVNFENYFNKRRLHGTPHMLWYIFTLFSVLTHGIKLLNISQIV